MINEKGVIVLDDGTILKGTIIKEDNFSIKIRVKTRVPYGVKLSEIYIIKKFIVSRTTQ